MAADGARAAVGGAVVGFMSSRSPEDSAHLVAAFRRGLADGGFVEGQNVAIEFRWANGEYDRLPAMAADLVNRQVAVIVAAGGRACGACREGCDHDDSHRRWARRRSREAWVSRQPQSAGRQPDRRYPVDGPDGAKAAWPAARLGARCSTDWGDAQPGLSRRCAPAAGNRGDGAQHRSADRRRQGQHRARTGRFVAV
jgi:hypothetical protein